MQSMARCVAGEKSREKVAQRTDRQAALLTKGAVGVSDGIAHGAQVQADAGWSSSVATHVTAVGTRSQDERGQPRRTG